MKFENEKVYVNVTVSTKTGKIKTVCTGISSGLARLAAMNTIKSTETCFVMDRDTAQVLFITEGKKNDFPNITEPENMFAHDYGFIDEEIMAIKDDRFDEEA